MRHRHLLLLPLEMLMSMTRRTAVDVAVLQTLEGRRLLSASVFDSEAVSARVIDAPIMVGQTVPAGYDSDGAPTEGTVQATPSTYGELHALPVPEFFGPQAIQTVEPQAAPLSETFQLNSRPGANQVIYLDFDGHTTTNTTWNFQGYGQTIVTPAFNSEGSDSSFTNNELTQIQNVWERVAEDFAPFDVNVTTQEPTQDYLRRSGSNDQEWGVRLVIGPNTFFSSAGGVAYVGSFNDTTDTPAFVFSPSLGNSTKNIAEATSHEAGHTLGLFHDGESPGDGDYYRGHDSGATGWAPIMGIGYGKQLTQWSKGEYTGATAFQDDLAIIAGNGNGFGYIADDYSDPIDTSGGFITQDVNGNFARDGLITTEFDQDTFAFTHGGGPLTVNVNVPGSIANLDAQLQLFRQNADGSFTAVSSSNPASSLNASISGSYTSGTYLARVDGLGKGNPFANSPSGYTDYGSIGQYRIFVDASPSDITAPVVTDMFLSSSSWSSSFLSSVDPTGGTGYAIVSNGQHVGGRTLPWSGLDTLTVKFSEEVLFGASGSSPLEAAVAGNAVGVASTYSYDAQTKTAVFTFNSSLTGGEATFGFSGGTTDFAGNELQASASARVLPGDANGDGVVSILDFAALRSAFSTTPVQSNYSVFTDYTGDGFVSILDFAVLRGNFSASA